MCLGVPHPRGAAETRHLPVLTADPAVSVVELRCAGVGVPSAQYQNQYAYHYKSTLLHLPS